MKKFASLVLAVLMICTMIPFAAIPASAEDTTTVMAETGTCHVKLKKDVSAYIKFTPSVSDNYIFISNIPEDTPGNPHMVAYLYEGTRKVVSYQPTPTDDKNFCISYSFKAGKTYKLEIQLKNVTSCTADVSLMKEVIPEGICEISGKCIIRQTGTFECEYFIVNANSSVIIDKSTTVNVKQGLANHGKIELLGKLDLSQAYAFQPGDISIGENGSLVDPDIKPDYYCDIITWHKNGGTIEGDSSAGDNYYSYYTNSNYWKKAAKMYEIVKPGYSFLGWYDNPDFNGEPVTGVGANETGNKDFYARFCKHEHFSSISVDTGNDKFSIDGLVYYRCDDCGLYSESNSAQNMIGDKNALDEWLANRLNAHILSCRYIDVSLDDSGNVISAEKEIDSKDFYTVNITDTAWGTADADTWYVCTTDMTLNNRVNIVGKVHLIIKDGCTLTAKNGIHLAEGNTLSVYAQSNGEAQGKLVANGGDGKAAIGGNGSESCGTLNVCGAAVIAEGNGVAGIGGGNGWNGADGSSQSAGGAGLERGIGIDGTNGTAGGNGGTVNVYAGTVTASGSVGIGGGNGGIGGRGALYSIDYGEYVSFQKGKAGRSGNGGNGSNITVYGGTVNASGDTLGIGGGKGGKGNYDTKASAVTSSGTDFWPNGELYYNQDIMGFQYLIAGTGGDGGNGGNGGTLTVKGGTVQLHGGVKAAGGGECGGTFAKYKGNGDPGSDTTFDLENCVLKAGDSESDMSVVSEYNGKKYFSVQYNSVSTLGSVLSNGSIWIIAAVAVVVVAGAAALVIHKKKHRMENIPQS